MHRTLEPQFVGRTFDDFLFRPQRGVVTTRRAVPLAARLTRKVSVELPVVSANMDSVTGARMAEVMALEGGLGFVHRGLSIEAQAAKVERVKRTHGHVVEKPLSLPRDATVREARQYIRKHDTTGLLIVDQRGGDRLAGLLSNRDMPSGHDQRPVSEFMTPVERLVTASPGVSAEEAEKRMFERRIEKLPLVDDEGRIRGLITKRDLMLGRQRPYSTKDAKGRLRVGAAIGARGDFIERTHALLEAGADVLLIDIAHGHSDVMKEAVEEFRRHFGAVELVCGNVGTAEGALFLREIGADAIKVGIGPGRGCRTRLETAAGVPQLQAVREAWCAVGETVPIIADGGIKNDKDIFLALACGASTVMLGSMLSGTDESPGVVIEDPGRGEKKKIYRGMTSPEAVFEALYDEDSPEAVQAALDTPAEGQQVEVPYRGSVQDILGRMRGHLRSSVSYGGEHALADLRAKVVERPFEYLIPLSGKSIRES